MDQPPPPAPARVPWTRGLVALGVFLALFFLTVGYHDGAFGTQDVGTRDLAEGTYRFKGTIEAWDPVNETFRLRDGTGARTFRWNVTEPRVGEVYVVDADVGAEGGWQALAVTRTIMIDGTWD